MVLSVHLGPDPLTDRSHDPLAARVQRADSAASRALRQELRRYCAGEIAGRSFLIAGHRGAGKTTLVAEVVAQLIEASERGEVPQRPLPVMLHGPSLFEALPSERAADAFPAIGDEAVRKSAEADTQRVLTQLILCLHRAVTKEYAQAYRQRLLERDPASGEPGLAERGELAAQFELEVMEDPHAARLREFWDRAGALSEGVLRRAGGPRADQGARELVALNGICNAHMRISGDLSGTIALTQKAERSESRETNVDTKLAELARPVTAVLSGAAVAAGTVAGGLGAAAALASGLGMALASAVVIRGNTTTKSKRERQVDLKLIPDLSARTLDRLLPTLLERLRDAGLAPIFVIDELDKVNRLPRRIESIVGHLKKLFAENVFSCFLTDRSYFEHLGRVDRRRAYGVLSSYFQHPLMVAYTPGDFAAYLDHVLKADLRVPVDKADKDILMWVLRHRAQMHALNLTRELVALRNDSGDCNIPGEQLRSQDGVYVIDATFQVAIEYVLNGPDAALWLLQNPRQRQTLYDALYFLSRAWWAQHQGVDLGEGAFDAFRDALVQRMNLDEMDAGEPACGDEGSLSKADARALFGFVRELAVLLSSTQLRERVRANWPAARFQREGEPLPPAPGSDVLEILREGPKSLLVKPEGGSLHYRFRWRPSGQGWEPEPVRTESSLQAPPAVGGAVPAAMPPDVAAARHDAERFARLDRQLGLLLSLGVPTPMTRGSSFRLLCDELSVLPKSPPWREALNAYTVIESVLGRANTQELADAQRHLGAFMQMLDQHLQVLEPVLATAALLAGLLPPRPDLGRDDQDHAGAMLEALQLLSAGLQFGATETRAIPEVMARAQRQSAALAAFGPVPELSLDLQGDLTDALAVLAMRLDAGRRLRGHTTDRALPVAAAWAQLVERLAARQRQGPQPTAGLEEIICAAAGRGPGQYLPLAPEQADLLQWSRLLLAGLGRLPGPQSSLPPAIVIPQVLLRLGLGRIEGTTLEALCQALQALADRAASAGAPGRRRAAPLQLEVRRALEDMKPGRSEPAPSGSLVLVLGPALWPRIAGWVHAPKSAFVLVLAPEDLRWMLDEADSLLVALPRPLRVRWGLGEGEGEGEGPDASLLKAAQQKLFFVTDAEPLLARDWERLTAADPSAGPDLLLAPQASR